MRTLHKGLVLGSLLALVASAPASAQDWKWDLGINGGYVWTTHVLTEDNTGYNGPGHNVMFDNGARVGLSLGYNFTPKLGLRLNGHYRWTNVTGNDMPSSDVNYIDGVNLWTGLADLIIRLKSPAETYAGMEMLPYLALGAGAKWHNPAGDAWLCNDPTNSQSFNCAPFSTGTTRVGATGPIHGWALGEENAVAFHAGLGADWRLSRALALTTELGVEAYKPQFYDANHTNGNFTNPITLPSGENRALYDTEVTADVGLKFLFGVKPAPVVAIAPPAAPPPPPPPAPEVRRESGSVCVVDPAAPNGLRMQTVTIVEGRDTVVSQNGSDVRFTTTLPSGVMVATGADWYVQGQPLVMTIGTNKASFTTYGSARMIDANDLTYVGRINGYPVYADRDDVSSFINELNQQNASGQDLGVILNNQKTLNTTFSNVKVLYVPTTAYGCTFQAVQRQEEVRKSGK